MFVLLFVYLFGFQPDELLSAKIQSLCPTISGNVCCTSDQFDTLRGQVQQVRYIIQIHYYHYITHFNFIFSLYKVNLVQFLFMNCGMKSVFYINFCDLCLTASLHWFQTHSDEWWQPKPTLYVFFIKSQEEWFIPRHWIPFTSRFSLGVNPTIQYLYRIPWFTQFV